MNLFKITPRNKKDKKCAKVIEYLMNRSPYRERIIKEIEKKYKEFFDEILYGGELKWDDIREKYQKLRYETKKLSSQS
jgi:hypothetical protein